MDIYGILDDPSHIYLSLFLALLGGAIGLPIPEDLPLLLAGVAVQQNLASPWLALLVCYTGIVLGDILIYTFGWYVGPGIFKKAWLKKRLPPHKIRAVRKSIENRGFITIFVARHLFYLRTVTFLTCGAVRMRMNKFIVADMLAALVSAPLMMTIGYVASSYFKNVVERLNEVKWLGALLALALVLIITLIYRWSGRRAEQIITANDNDETTTSDPIQP
jgi:membrane protein DedA with SNARE-associated domain